MDNAYNQSQVAYESAPKERPYKKDTKGDKQFPGDKMEQANVDVNPEEPANPSLNKMQSDSDAGKKSKPRAISRTLPRQAVSHSKSRYHEHR